MSDDKNKKDTEVKNEKPKVEETKKVDKQIQERPVEIESGEGKKAEIKKDKEEKKKEVKKGKENSKKEGKQEPVEKKEKEVEAEPELSEEEQKKLKAEAKKKKTREELEKNREEFRPGDTIKVYTKVKEGDKERIQGFEGVVISKRGRGISKTFMVRKIATGRIGVERIWPLYSPTIVKIDIVQKGKVRRAKLYYMRDRIGKAAMKVKTREVKKK